MIFYLIIDCMSAVSVTLKFGALQSHFPHGIRNLINWYWRVATAGQPRVTLHNSNCHCGVLRVDVSLLCWNLQSFNLLEGKNEFMFVKESFIYFSCLTVGVRQVMWPHEECVGDLTKTQQIHGCLAALLRAGFVLHLQEREQREMPINCQNYQPLFLLFLK